MLYWGTGCMRAVASCSGYAMMHCCGGCTDVAPCSRYVWSSGVHDRCTRTGSQKGTDRLQQISIRERISRNQHTKKVSRSVYDVRTTMRTNVMFFDVMRFEGCEIDPECGWAALSLCCAVRRPIHGYAVPRPAAKLNPTPYMRRMGLNPRLLISTYLVLC
jgi:hypothetical protein